MKFATFIFILFTFFFVSFGQAADNDSLPPKKRHIEHDLFINTTFFLKQVINLSSTSLAISPYIVGYKCFFDKHNGIRVSAGGQREQVEAIP